MDKIAFELAEAIGKSLERAQAGQAQGKVKILSQMQLQVADAHVRFRRALGNRNQNLAKIQARRILDLAKKFERLENPPPPLDIRFKLGRK